MCWFGYKYLTLPSGKNGPPCSCGHGNMTGLDHFQYSLRYTWLDHKVEQLKSYLCKKPSKVCEWCGKKTYDEE